MDMKEIQELAKAAAHSAVIGYTANNYSLGPNKLVDVFLETYQYALEKISQKQHQSQNEVNMEFGSNEARFR